MSVAAVRRVVSRLEPGSPPTDAELVNAIAPVGVNREAAFAELVSRYGSMVLGVCRGVLADSHAAEDAFQAVFLVLARKASTINPPGAVGGWLYGVAVRTARKAKTAAARRQRREMAAIVSANPDQQVGGELDRSELRAVIDAELAALPEPHRAAIVLCDLQGKTRSEAALELNRPEGTVAAWLSRGRKTLAARLARRGVSLPAAGLVAVVTPSVVSAELSSAALGTFVDRGVSDSVLALAEGVMRSLSSASTKLVAGLVAVGALLAAVATAAAWHATPEPNTVPVAAAPFAPVPKPKPEPDMKEFADHKGYIYSVSYAPDGKRFVSVGNKTAIVWDAETRKKLYTVDAEFASFSDDGKSFFYLTKDEFHIADSATGKSREKLARGMPKQVIGGRWATVSGDGSARVEFDGVQQHVTSYPVKGAVPVLADQKDHNPLGSTIVPNHGRGGAFAPGGIERFAGIHAATTDYKETACLTIWKLAGGERVGTIFRGNKFFHPVQSFAWSPDGKEIAVGHIDGVWVYDATTLKEVRKFDKSGDAGAVAWSKDGKTLAVAVREGVGAAGDFGPGESKIVATAFAVVLLDATTGKELRRVEGFPDNLPIVSLAFRPDGKQLVCGAGFFPGDGPAGNLPQPAKDARGLRVIPLGEPPAKPAPAAKPITDVSFSPDGAKYLAVGGGTVTATDTATGKVLYAVAGEAARFGTDGKTLFVMSDKVLECDADTGKVAKRYDRPKTKFMWHFVRFSPDGKRYAAHFGFNAGVYDTATGFEPVRLDDQHEPGGGGWVQGATGKVLCWSADGKQVAAVGVLTAKVGKLGAVVWDAKTGKRTHVSEGEIEGGPLSAAFSPDGDNVAVAFKDRVEVWVIGGDAKKNPVRTFGTAGIVTALAYSKDGKFVAAGIRNPLLHGGEKVPRVIGHKTEVQVFDSESGKELQRFDGFEGVDLMATTRLPVTALAFSPDGKKLLAGTGFSPAEPVPAGPLPTGEVKVFDLTAPPEKPDPAPVVEQKWTDAAVLTDHGALVNGVAVAPDGKSFAAATAANVTCWDAVTRKVLWKTKADMPLLALAYSPDGKHICLAGRFDVVRLDAKTGKENPWHVSDRAEIEIRFGKMRALAYHPAGKQLAASDGYVTKVQNLAQDGEETSIGAPPKQTEPASVLPAGVAWSKDGKRLAVIRHEKVDGKYAVTLWDVGAKADAVKLLAGHTDTVTAVTWSKDGKVIASGGNDGLVIAWDAATGKELWRHAFKGRDDTIGRINALAISPADNTVAVAVSLGSGKGPERVVLLDAATGEHVGLLPRQWSIPAASVAWSPDGKFLVTGCGVSPGVKIAFIDPPVGEVTVWERKP